VLEVLGDRARTHVEGAGDGKVGAAARRELQDLYLAVGQVGQAVGPRRRQRGTRAVPIARPPHRVGQRRSDRRQHRAIILGKVSACPVQRDGRELTVLSVRQAERNLVFDRNMAKEF
jgi:hypothetical protein